MANTAQLGTQDAVLGLSFVLASGAGTSPIKDVDASDSLALSQSATVETSILSVSASNTIILTDSVENNVFLADGSNALSLGHEANVGAPRTGIGSSVLTVGQQADFIFGGYGLTAISTLVVSQSLRQSLKNLTAVTPSQDSGDPQAPGTIEHRMTDTWVVAARIADTFEVSATSVLVMAQTLPNPTGKLSVFASNTLAALDFADTFAKRRNVTDTIIISQTAAADKIKVARSQIVITQLAEQGIVKLFADSPIVLSQFVRPKALARSASSVISLTDSVRSSTKNVSATSSIPLAQTIVSTIPYKVSALTKISGVTDPVFTGTLPPTLIPGVPFGLTQTVTLQTNLKKTTRSQMTLSDRAVAVRIKASAVDVDASSVINAAQIARLSLTSNAISTIVFNTNAVANLNTKDGVTRIEDLDQQAASLIVKSDSLQNTLVIKQSVAYTLVKDTTICDYSPFIGSSDSGITPPPAALPPAAITVIPGVRFRLVSPPFEDGPAIDTLDLRAPNLGNRERLEATRIQRETVGGTLIVYADPQWPKVHSLQLQFQALKTEQARGLINFIERHTGEEIGLYDHEQRIWRAVITNPEEAIIHDRRNSYSATIEMEAERVDAI
jgi:hypothetical protein